MESSQVYPLVPFPNHARSRKWFPSNIYCENHIQLLEGTQRQLWTTLELTSAYPLGFRQPQLRILWHQFLGYISSVGDSLYPPEFWGLQFYLWLRCSSRSNKAYWLSFRSAFYLLQDRVAISSHLLVKLETGNQPCTF